MAVPRIEPMSSVAGTLPPDDGRWAFEPKWDGMRVIVEIDGGTVRLRGRSGRDVTVEFPELAALSTVAPSAVLDGEIVALDDDGRPSFSQLQHRFGITDPGEAAALSHSIPVTFVAFDLLHLGGTDSWALPYSQRRELLEALIDPEPPLSLTPSGGGGQEWLDAARSHGLEGIMAKRIDRPYLPGRRSDAWRKIKIRHEQDFAVCGWTPGQGNRSGGIGALVLGCHEPAGWHWVGNAGSGLSDADLDGWITALAADQVETPPFDPDTTGHLALRGASWVTPTYVVQIAFTEWTGDRHLRQPTVLGRRHDVAAADVSCADETLGES